MNEKLESIDLELKGLFMKQDIESLVTKLGEIEPCDVLEMTELNHAVVKKYYDQGQIDLIRKHITFVAYSSFLIEYAGKAQLYEKDVFTERFSLYERIFERLSAGPVEDSDE